MACTASTLAQDRLLRQRYTVQDVIADQPVGDQLVLLNLASGIYYSLNPVGACIWAGLVAGKTAGELIHAVLGRFETTPEVAARDVEAFLQTLAAWGLITPS